MLRPGVAQTQAILARELSGNSDEASRLFRQSVTFTRQIEQTELGRTYFERCQSIIAQAQSAHEELSQAAESPTGEGARGQVLLDDGAQEVRGCRRGFGGGV